MLGTSGGAFVAGSWARYRPYGSYRTTPTQTLTDRDFTGQRENRELGLIYYQARFYHPSIGRFISPDTIVPDPVNPQQLNRYTYSLNSPIRFSDPTGHVCYDPNTDAATSGNCNGGSKPKVTPRSHKGSDNTISPGFELSNDDLLLLTLGVFAENQNASHPPQAMTLWTWMFLSKQALNPENSMYEIINFASGAWNDPNFVNPYKKVLGVPPTDGAGHRAWLLQAANGYMNSSSNNAKNFQALYTQIAGEDAQAIDGGIYDEWRANGTNSTADPTHGSVFAVHRAASRFENELGPLFVDYAQSNPAFSYVFSPPYLGIMTVTGNDTCVYDHTLCE
ncbi:MAG: RHS repeat-associated core domain-containing protein [Ardenticatenaceae bacterium]|nr:RHS repeat-associated core domain-containing protein [Ardenticatenaceae bacterium]